uniref:Adipocyte plasma membrane-associated protein n=1 Tax=Aegilops tauschii TaxID=37682 RepID=N1R526_AEGTA
MVWQAALGGAGGHLLRGLYQRQGGVRARLGQGLGACLSTVVGSHGVVSSPGPPGLAGDAGVGASYGGGAYPDSVTDVGLGVDGMPGRWPRMAVRMVALRQASWRRWWLSFQFVWAARGVAAGGSRVLSALRLDSCRGSQDPMKEHECGRPLGLKFNNKTGELYVADSYFGLRVVSPGDNVSRLIGPGQPGRPYSFANGVEIDQETGVVYFTETSTRFQRRQFLNIVISGDATGRLLKYDPNTNEVQVLVDGLAFPNGLLMSEGGSHLLLAETTTCMIHRYWLKTPKASTLEELVQLPGFPDNIKASPRGGFWVGLHGKRGKIAEWSTSFPWLRRLVMKLPPQRVQRVMAFLSRFGSQVIALRVSEEGKVLEEVIVHDAARKMFGSISELEERDGCLWIGSVHLPFLGHYCL